MQVEDLTRLITKIDTLKDTGTYPDMKTKLKKIKELIDLTADNNIAQQDISPSERKRTVKKEIAELDVMATRVITAQEAERIKVARIAKEAED